jgi:hypothetical protein
VGKGEGLKVLFLIELIYCDIIGAWEGVCHVDPVGKKKKKKTISCIICRQQETDESREIPTEDIR